MSLSQEYSTYTQRLSTAIDEAFEGYEVGDLCAEEKLYNALHAQAHNVAIHHLDWNQVPAVERDIVHRAMMNLGSFRGKCRPSTWFYRLAVNEANRALRDHIIDRARLVPITTKDEEGEEQERQIEAKPTNYDASIDLEQLRRRLPPNQAELICLMQQGNSLEEIAQKTGKPVGTVRSRYRLMKKKFRKLRHDWIARWRK
jgi:RNA polymerase sigma factor (sigma-70 family)